MKKLNLSTCAASAFVIILLGFPSSVAFAGGMGFGKEVFQDNSKADIGLGKFASFPFHVTVSARGGYDDNVNLTRFNTRDSFFTNIGVGVNYVFGSPRTQINLTSNASFTYYFDRQDAFSQNSDDFDINLSVGLGIAHKVTPRLTVTANMYVTYQSQPDFQTFNNGNFTFSRQDQNFFFTVNKFSVGYAWTPRFSTVSSYTIGYTDYDSDVVSVFQDRFEHTIGNEFRFLVMPTTTAVAEYRYGIVDYTDSDIRNSNSHYFLLGVDHSFSPRFNISTRAGVEFREYCDNGLFGQSGGDQTSPYGELTLNYAVAQGTALSWTNRYSIEQSDVPELLSRQTYRTAVSLRHNFTSRIVGGLNVAYQNDDYDGNFLRPGFTEDSFDISVSVRYAITRNWALDAGYHHTEVISDANLFREYARNRYYFGASFTF